MNTKPNPSKQALEAALKALDELGVTPYQAFAADVAMDAVVTAKEIRDEVANEAGDYGWRDEVANEADPESAYDMAIALADTALAMGEILELED